MNSQTFEDRKWCKEEFSGVNFGDKRLKSRLAKTATLLLLRPLSPINKSCLNWASTKGAYRLFANEKVSSNSILKTHQEETARRCSECKAVLAVQDTTSLNYSDHNKTTGLGMIGRVSGSTAKGLWVHSTLAFTPQGIPLGLIDQQIWARSPAKRDPWAYKQEHIEDKESYRWVRHLKATQQLISTRDTTVVSVADREADIYELLLEAGELNASYVIRAAYDRRVEAEDDTQKKLRMFLTSLPSAKKTIDVPPQRNKPARKAEVTISHGKVTLSPPQRRGNAKGDPLPSLTIYAILITESNPQKGTNPLDWLLLTNVPVETLSDAEERIRWYRVRWQIECYHKVLKSGFRIEDCRLQTAERLEKFITLTAILGYRVFFLTYFSRQNPNASCALVLSETEWKALYCITCRTASPPTEPPILHLAVRWIAQLGGFLGRKGDGNPGITTVWRGLQELAPITETWKVFNKTCG